MIKKRLIGVITVKQGWAVQSFGFGRYLPLGRPEVLAENLDRWGADEILLQCIDRTRSGSGPDIALLEVISRCGLSTPLIYAGGIRHAQDAVDVVQAAADRVVVDALLHDNLNEVAKAGARLGNQAIIGSVPMSDEGWLDYRTGRSDPPSARLLELLQLGVISEALLIDWKHEGVPNSFDLRLLDMLEGDFPLIAFGGVSSSRQLGVMLAHPRLVAVGVGNFLNYREHAIQSLKEAILHQPLRPATYQQIQTD